MMPWRNMAHGWSAPKDSLSLNYVSPLNVVALVRALKASHYIVAIALTNSLLIAGMTIISTGLLNSKLELIDVKANITVLDQFNFTEIQSERAALPQSAALYASWRFNESLPFGTTEEYATSSLSFENTTGSE